MGVIRHFKNANNGTDRQIRRHTDRHCNLETESVQWADSVKTNAKFSLRDKLISIIPCEGKTNITQGVLLG